MTSTSLRPILITGSHRSGSTWVGKVLGLSSSLAYVHEPFHPGHRPGICRARFDHWFQYVCESNESAYLADLADTLRFRYHLGAGLRGIDSMKDALWLVRDYLRFAYYRTARKRPLIKDPIAFFSAEWLARRLDMEVVVLIRHPAAFAGSLKKKNWTFDFHQFTAQPLLMEHQLSRFRTQIEAYALAERDIIDQAILLWNVIHDVVINYRDRHPDWIFLRHETLSSDPLGEFRALFSYLGIDFTTSIEQALQGYSFYQAPGAVQRLRRDSQANILSWQSRLTAEEVVRIRENTSEIASRFYTDEDWGEASL